MSWLVSLTEMPRAGDMAGANTRLAIKYAQGIHTRTGKKVAILYPDVPELERAVEQSGSNNPRGAASVGSGSLTSASPAHLARPD